MKHESDKVDIVLRNLLRLIDSNDIPDDERERIEPMSEWKWKKLYSLSCQYGIGSWVADGVRHYEDDFFLQPSPTLRQQLLELNAQPKDPDKIARFRLHVSCSGSLLRRFSPESLRAYANDAISTLKNIEE